MRETNKQILLAARPKGFPKESDFQLLESPTPAPAGGQFLVGVSFLSVDPYMRGRMNEQRSYADPVALGEVMTGGGVGRVLQSRHSGFAEGDYVVGQFGWQQYALSDGSGVRKVDPAAAPISTALGVLGMPGLTAYFGLLEVANPRAGETVLVSGAGGAVGSLVGQIARMKGCRVVGIAGTGDKIAWITGALGFDAALNYRTTSDYGAALRQLCPSGIDVYFDNVGGAITDSVFPLLNPRGRVSICGQISLYNLREARTRSAPVAARSGASTQSGRLSCVPVRQPLRGGVTRTHRVGAKRSFAIPGRCNRRHRECTQGVPGNAGRGEHG